MSEYDKELYNELFLTTKILLLRGAQKEDIEKHLLQKTNDSILIAIVIKEARNVHYAALRKEGLARIMIGSIIVLLGFAITFFNFHTNRSVDLVLYGFTTTGILIVFWGLYKMFG
jgi:hypothetical protein